MIPAASLKVGKKTHKLKFSTSALMRLEADNGGAAFDGLLDSLIKGTGGITLVVSALAAGLDNGNGVAKEEAVAFIDAAGGVRKVVGFVAEAMNAAFSFDEGDEGDEGNGEAPAEA